MKTYLERQHRQRLQERGWDAQVHSFDATGCSFRFCGREYSLTRSGDGFLVRCGQKLIWPVATYPDAALAHVWRHSRYN